MRLSEVIESQQDRILKKWMERVNGTLVPDGMNTRELVDHLPQFLSDVASALHSRPEPSANAAEHGLQRLRLGFDLSAVVLEYSELRHAIVDVAGAAGVAILPHESEILVDTVIQGIADAVSEYARQRDAELQRQATQHFAFIAHELRNPLMNARLALALMDRRAGEKPLQALERSLGHMHGLIEHSLELAREGSGITLERVDAPVGEVLRELQLVCLPIAESKGVDLQIELVQLDVNADLRLLHSALINLVSNGIKYTPHGGSVKLRVRTTDRRVTFEVEDSCGGLPPGMVETAFNPFVRHHASHDGYGLGLSIVKQAADAHGGMIRVQDIPGKGCIFGLELPIVPAA